MSTVSGPTPSPTDVSLIQLSATSPATSIPADKWMAELQVLLRELETVTAATRVLPPVFSEVIDEQLVQIRLGTAAGLFAALQFKHSATAGHSLRVALMASAWALRLRLSEKQRNDIEVSALLHDIGVIGVPDNILLKASTLDADEAATMLLARKMSTDILRRSGASPQIIEIVENIATWYNGSRKESNLSGKKIPLGARMIAIVEAFDAMITDHVYRPARSQERAISELFECAGSQFDPELVQSFADFQQEDQTAIRLEIAHRWLHAIDPSVADSFWGVNSILPSAGMSSTATLFESRLLENMYDAVIFIDATGRITLWNRGAERLTGITSGSICGQLWNSSFLGLADEKGQLIEEKDCPIQTALRCGVQSLRRLKIVGRGQRSVAVDAHTIPVIDDEGISQGVIMLLHDASSETSLEQRCQNLHEKATKDPLTEVANRAEFDRVHAMFVAAHQQQRIPCSLLMCDLDRFKLINDTFGHQAGDAVIQCLAALLKRSCRPGDLVARYGGEEFVMLCADCDNAAAARRADEIRRTLAKLPQPMLDGRTVTVSFGVTEIQPGDTPETMLRRADRALLMAKNQGRNCVVQLGVGSQGESVPPDGGFFMVRPKEVVQQEVVTAVPLRMAIEKLRGFVADHRAKFVAIDGNHVQLEIEDGPTSQFRRITDRSVIFCIDLQFEEERRQYEHEGSQASTSSFTTRTRIKISVGPKRNRDRRKNDVMARAREVLISCRSYLMATPEEPTTSGNVLKRILVPWLLRKSS